MSHLQGKACNAMPVRMNIQQQVIAPVQAAEARKVTSDTHVSEAQMALCRAAAW